MFERIGRDPDPDGCVRRIVAAVFLVSVVVCSGLMAAAEWITWVLLRLGWELLRWLLQWWLGVALPPLELLQPPELTVVAVAIDAPVIYDDRWEQTLPDRPLPTLHPLPAVAEVGLDVGVDEISDHDVLVEEIVRSAGLLKLIGTMGSSDHAVLADLWGDEGGLGSIDQALSEASLIGVAGGGGLGLVGGGSLEGGGEIGVLRGIGTGGDLGGERSARVVRLADPNWPTDAREGRCAVDVEVDRRGAGVVDGWVDCDPALRDAVERAVRRSTFQPARRGGEPTAEVIWVEFRRPDPRADAP